MRLAKLKFVCKKNTLSYFILEKNYKMALRVAFKALLKESETYKKIFTHDT